MPKRPKRRNPPNRTKGRNRVKGTKRGNRKGHSTGVTLPNPKSLAAGSSVSRRTSGSSGSRKSSSKSAVDVLRSIGQESSLEEQGPISSVVLARGNEVTLREWDRGTEMLSWFAVSGWLAEQMPDQSQRPLRPASVLLVGSPGSGKTELVDRFRTCYWVSYHNDLTVRSLLPLLRRSDEGIVTHVGCPEFNKLFQRKAGVYENCVGLLAQAMEEGISTYSVGGTTLHFRTARLGLLGGMTPRTLGRRKEFLGDAGFLSRCAVIEWEMPREERNEIMHRINVGDTRDLEPVRLRTPPSGQRAVVRWNPEIGKPLMEYVKRFWPENDLRTFSRFRTLSMGIAYTYEDAEVTREHLDVLLSYDDYWQRMVKEDGV